jgi:hypothetical protein
MSESYEGIDYSISQYVRQVWLANYCDGDESNEQIDSILQQDFLGVRVYSIDESGEEIDDNDIRFSEEEF